MILSDWQTHMLLALLQSSLDENKILHLCYDLNTRSKLYDEIMNQQSKDLFNTASQSTPDADEHTD